MSVTTVEKKVSRLEEIKAFYTGTEHPDIAYLLSLVEKQAKAIELALYYVDGDSAHEILKAKINLILEGETDGKI